MEQGKIRGLVTIAAAMWLTTEAIAQPANDTCAAAETITIADLHAAVTIHGTTLGATEDIHQSCGVNDNLDVWYSFVAPVHGLWYFDTLNSGFFDTTLSIYSSCGSSPLACNDDIDSANVNFWSAIAIELDAGQAVKIRMSMNNSDSNAFVLNVVGSRDNANNSCNSPETIIAGQPRSGSTLLATTDFVLPAASCGNQFGCGGGSDVFYSFTPTSTQSYRVTLCGSGFDTVLAVLTDCSGSVSSIVACNDDSLMCLSGLNSQIDNVQLTAGVQYLIRVAGFDYPPPDAGTYTLLVSSLTTGVCCRGATCMITQLDECIPVAGVAGVVFGPGSDCNASAVNNSPCCFADYNKVGGIGVQDIFDFLSDWFAGSAFAAIGSSSPQAPSVSDIFSFLSTWFAGGC